MRGMADTTDTPHIDDAAARLLRTVATDPHLRAVLGIDGRPVVDVTGRRIDADTPDDVDIVTLAVLAAHPPADDDDDTPPAAGADV